MTEVTHDIALELSDQTQKYRQLQELCGVPETYTVYWWALHTGAGYLGTLAALYTDSMDLTGNVGRAMQEHKNHQMTSGNDAIAIEPLLQILESDLPLNQRNWSIAHAVKTANGGEWPDEVPQPLAEAEAQLARLLELTGPERRVDDVFGRAADVCEWVVENLRTRGRVDP